MARNFQSEEEEGHVPPILYVEMYKALHLNLYQRREKSEPIMHTHSPEQGSSNDQNAMVRWKKFTYH